MTLEEVVANMKKAIVVFGASGDVGRYAVDYLVDHLDADEYSIVAVGTRDFSYFGRRGIEYIRVDITKPEQFDGLPTHVYAVIDLAGAMPAKMPGFFPHQYIDVNINGTINILEYCRKNQVDRIVYAHSFGDIKDNAEKDILLRVDSPIKFSLRSDHSIYVISKIAAVNIIKYYHEVYGLKYFILRLPNIYMYSSSDSFFVDGVERKIAFRYMIDRAIRGESIEVWGDPSRVKDIVYVKDLCQMIYRCILSDRTAGFYNVGTGIGISLEDQIKGIIEVFCSEKKSEMLYAPGKPNAPQYIMDIEPARREIGYNPEYSNYLLMLEDYKKEMEEKRFE